ncbi:unnamed protein product [Ambrosiozyma monospora]|uniref:Unnamed protein product n=1 Tax=Ambrosiozyma monospora TaxID=43982 RepID=A0ACB5UDC6_AMBMO|nr:unnamed protein product [Ambrosiozyma monospora]
MEAELAEGFKKWVIIEEQDIERDNYDVELEIKQEKLKELEDKITAAQKEAKRIKQEAKKRALDEQEKLKMEPIPPPLPSKDYTPLSAKPSARTRETREIIEPGHPPSEPSTHDSNLRQ